MAITVGDLVEVLERAYPPATAQSWDAVGLVCGDPAAEVSRVLLAVDPVDDVIAEAEQVGAELIVTHHPLLLKGVHSVSAATPKGRLIHRLIRSGIALYVAHTNADAARGGVNEALADLLGLVDVRPLAPEAAPMLTLVCYVPAEAVAAVIDAAAAAGAGTIGEYHRCAWTTEGTGTYEASDAANPVIGTAGERTATGEVKLEMVLPAGRADHVVEAVRAAHPYEEPALHLLTQQGAGSSTGIGRVGRLPQPQTLAALAQHVADVLPATAHGVRVSGPGEAMVQTVALCGGAGDSLFGQVRASGADAYLTADLRHHPASEARLHGRDGRPYLLDVSHWASEWPWLPTCETLLQQAFPQLATTVSTRSSDPWTFRVDQPGGNP